MITLPICRAVVKDYRGLSDFERINGVDGVYIANVADTSVEPELKLFGGLQSVFLNLNVVLTHKINLTF